MKNPFVFAGLASIQSLYPATFGPSLEIAEWGMIMSSRRGMYAIVKPEDYEFLQGVYSS
jgi:hypothetical protein